SQRANRPSALRGDQRPKLGETRASRRLKESRASLRVEGRPGGKCETAGGLEREAAAVIEDLGLSNRQDAWTDTGGDRTEIIAGAHSYNIPSGFDHMRPAVRYGNNKVEAVRRQRAQDQVEVAEIVKTYAGASGAAARKARAAGEVHRQIAGGRRGAGRELR